MFNITTNFGSTSWPFLYKEKEKAEAAFAVARTAVIGGHPFELADDFGQEAAFTGGSVTGVMLEDYDLTEAARIYRSIANARGEVKARQQAMTDPVIRQGQNAQPSVLTPRFNG